MPPKHVRTQSNSLYSALEGGRQASSAATAAVGPGTKAFKEQRVKSVHGEDVCVEIGECVGR